ncbi:MAG: hypothetical protein ACC700_19595 [Anaerolineales bacterium]
MSSQLVPILDEFMQTVDTVYGVYLDSTTGYKWAKERLEQAQQNSLEMFNKEKGEDWTLEDLDAKSMAYGRRDPNTSEAEVIHKGTQLQFKQRNSHGGLNFKVIGNLCAVLLYQYWENHYRPQIGKLRQVPSNEVQFDVMGDLRHIRSSIIHHRAIALPEIDKCVILKWFTEGDEIIFAETQFDELVRLIKRGIDEMASDQSAEADQKAEPETPAE